MVEGQGSGASEIEQQVRSIVSRFNELVRIRDELEHQGAIRDGGIRLLHDDLGDEIEEIRLRINDIYSKIEEAARIKASIVSDLRDVAKIDSFARMEKRIDQRDYEDNISRGEFIRQVARRR